MPRLQRRPPAPLDVNDLQKGSYPGDTVTVQDPPTSNGAGTDAFDEGKGIKAPPGARGEFVEGRPPGNIGVPINPSSPQVTDTNRRRRDTIPPMFLPQVASRHVAEMIWDEPDPKDDEDSARITDYWKDIVTAFSTVETPRMVSGTPRRAFNVYPVPAQPRQMDERLLLQIPHDVQDRYSNLHRRVSDYVKQIKLNALDMYSFPTDPPEKWVEEERQNVQVDWNDSDAWATYVGKLNHDDVADWIGLEAMDDARLYTLAPNLHEQHALEAGTEQPFASWFRTRRPTIDGGLVNHLKETARSFPNDGLGRGYSGHWRRRNHEMVRDIATSRARERYDRYNREVAYQEYVKPNYKKSFDDIVRSRSQHMPLSDVVNSLHSLPIEGEDRETVDGFRQDLDGLVNEGVHALDLYRPPVSRDDRMFGEMEHEGEKWVPVRRIEGVGKEIPLLGQIEWKGGVVKNWPVGSELMFTKFINKEYYINLALAPALTQGEVEEGISPERKQIFKSTRGWIVDLELRRGLVEFILHRERHFPTRQQALSAFEQTKQWVDSLTFEQLMQEAKGAKVRGPDRLSYSVPVPLYRYGNRYFLVHETDKGNISPEMLMIRATIFAVKPGSSLVKVANFDWEKKSRALASAIREIEGGADKEATFVKYGRDYGPGIHKAVDDYLYVSQQHKKSDGGGGGSGSTIGDSTCSTFNDQSPDNCAGCTFNVGTGGPEFGYGDGACLLTHLFLNAPEKGFGKSDIAPYDPTHNPGTPSVQKPTDVRRRDPRVP